MVIAAAVVSLILLVAGIAVIAGMIIPNASKIGYAFRGGKGPIELEVVAPTERPVREPRVVATRALLRAAA